MKTLALAALAALAACNPFAPDVEEGDPFGSGAGDPRTLDGFFVAFQSAYELRDIALYEPLLDSSFTFVYYDYDAQVERAWGYAQELESTRRLFAESETVQLRWNQVLVRDVAAPPLQARIVRSFDLTVSLAGGESFRGNGNVNFLLTRADTSDAWRLVRWRDESEL